MLSFTAGLTCNHPRTKGVVWRWAGFEAQRAYSLASAQRAYSLYSAAKSILASLLT